jgi:hypothetical protein
VRKSPPRRSYLMDRIERGMKESMARIIFSFRVHNIVLGSFGIRVFQNHVKVVGMFIHYTHGSFSHINFAISTRQRLLRLLGRIHREITRSLLPDGPRPGATLPTAESSVYIPSSFNIPRSTTVLAVATQPSRSGMPG